MRSQQARGVVIVAMWFGMILMALSKKYRTLFGSDVGNNKVNVKEP